MSAFAVERSTRRIDDSPNHAEFDGGSQRRAGDPTVEVDPVLRISAIQGTRVAIIGAMDSDKLEHIRDAVQSKRGELREEATEALLASDAGRALVLKHCRAAGATAHARHVGREHSPFAFLLRPEGIGAVPFETWAARHDAWLEGWDAAAMLALD